MSARAKVTQRNVPPQASLPAGSCSRMNRPVPSSSSPSPASAAGDHVAAHGERERGDALGRGHRVDHDLGAQHGAAHLLDRSGERRGSAIDLASGHPPCDRRRVGGQAGTDTPPDLRTRCLTQSSDRDARRQSPSSRACRGEPADHIPVWFMRQAGRSLPEYLAIREGVPMLESCFRTDLVVEITMQPVRRYGVDAAIFFSDIVVPLKAIGVDLDIVPGIGPVVADPIRRAAQLDQLRDLEPDDVASITDAAKALVGELGGTPLIGFAGAPFTLASYLVEGGPSRDHRLTKELMYAEPELWHALLGRLAEIAGQFLRLQIEAGASADPAVRLVGRCAVAGRLPAVRRTALGRRARRGGRPRRPAHPLRRRHRRAARRHGRSRAPTSSASTGGCRSTRPCAGSVPARPCRATSTRRCCSRPTELVHARAAEVIAAGRRPAGMCSTSGTACCPPPTPTRWPGSSTSCTALMRVAVVGGGIGGLAAAYWLEPEVPGASVDVFEGSDRVGGKLRLETVGDVTLDVGAEAMLARRPEAIELAEDMALGDRRVHPDTTSASIWTRGRYGRCHAPSWGSRPMWPRRSPPASSRSRPSAGRCPCRNATSRSPSTCASAPATKCSSVSSSPCSAAFTPGTPTACPSRPRGSSSSCWPRPARHSGAGPAGRRPRLRGAGRRYRPAAGRVGGASGCRRPPQRCCPGRRARRWRWVLHTDRGDQRYDAVVVATPAPATSRLLADVAPRAAFALADVEVASVAIVTFVFHDDLDLTGSGFLVPPVDGTSIKAATFSSSKWGWLAEPGRTVLRASVGRAGDTALLHHDDATVAEAALADLRSALGPLPEPAAWHVQRWGGALPQYDVGHLERLDTIDAESRR